MDKRMARPVFVVGSPRSGTSILTWAIGQHPSFLPTEEAPGRGPFAVAVGAHFATGSGRGARSHLSALGISRDEFYVSFGNAIDSMIIGHRLELERLSEATARVEPTQVSKGFAVSRGAQERKRRWVDGTPESSFYICGLNRLFPEAKFIHILRDVGEVVPSMLGFRNDDGSPLVRTADEGCDYWLRATQACVLAQRALGPEKVRRLRYADLVANPEIALRGICEFLGEEFAPECLEPLALRINSSPLSEDTPLVLAAGQSAVVDEALRLSALLQNGLANMEALPEARARLEADFEERVQYALQLESRYALAQRILGKLEVELRESVEGAARIIDDVRQNRVGLRRTRFALGICGALFVALWLASATVWLRPGRIVAAGALVMATLSLLIYAFMRRAGLRAALMALFALDRTKERR